MKFSNGHDFSRTCESYLHEKRARCGKPATHYFAGQFNIPCCMCAECAAQVQAYSDMLTPPGIQPIPADAEWREDDGQ